MATIEQLEGKAREHNRARNELVMIVSLINSEIEAIKKKRMEKLRKAVASATETGDELLALVKESPQLFIKPKSAVLHGIKIGFKKEKGKITFADETQVIKLIRKHMPEMAELLIITSEKPSKEAMNNLDAKSLKQIGVTVTSDSDVAFITDPSSDIDKLINALLKGATEDEEVAA